MTTARPGPGSDVVVVGAGVMGAWTALGESAGEQLFVPAGALWFAHADDGFEAASEATHRELGIPVERLSQETLAARWPQLAAGDMAFAIFQPEAGLLMARRGVRRVLWDSLRRGRGMKLTPDRYGPIFDPSHGERIVDPESVRLARRYLSRRFPDLADAPVVETRVCQYETTPDSHFVIDRHPGFDNVWLVGGGSGHGFKHGPVIGRHVVGRLDGAGLAPGEERFSLDHSRVPQATVRTGADGMVEGWADGLLTAGARYSFTSSGPSGTSIRIRPLSTTTG